MTCDWLSKAVDVKEAAVDPSPHPYPGVKDGHELEKIFIYKR